MRRALALLACLVALLVAPTVAHANGRFPTANHLVVAPTQPSRLMLRTTFGLLLSGDGGGTWDWVCERAVGYGAVQDPAVAITGSGALLAGLLEGLAVSTDGCGWAFADGPLAKQSFVDVAVRRTQPNVAVALSSTFHATGDAGALYDSFVFRSADGGATWSRVGDPLDATLLLETIDVTESDPQRVYISGVRIRGAERSGVLLVSTDGGTTWVERQIPLQIPGESAPYIAAIDPSNADRVYVRNNGASSNRLLVTDDAGRSFKVVYTSQGPLLGFALSPDGGSFYFGGPEDGLYAGVRDTLAFQKKSDVHVLCLATSGPTLWACSLMTSGFIVGASDDGGKTFAPKLRLDGVRGPLGCGTNTSVATCAADWPQLHDMLASGRTEPSGPLPPPSPGPSAAGGHTGCSTTALPSRAPFALCALAFLVASWRLRAGRPTVG